MITKKQARKIENIISDCIIEKVDNSDDYTVSYNELLKSLKEITK